jgi:heme exporter protein C
MRKELKIGIGLWMVAGLAYVFLKLPAAKFFADPELARIVALHLPCAYVAVTASWMSAWHGWKYLQKRELIDDARSASGAGLALLFCALTTATGSIFAYVQWGSFWNWDPRETSVFLLMLIYCAYFVLRSSIEDIEKRGAICAVFGLFVAVMTPLLGYVIPKYLMSLHPTNTKFDSSYRTAIYMGILPPLLGMMFWIQNIALRLDRARLALEEVDYN